MQELNLTPTQTLILFFVLGLLGLLLSRSKSLIDIDLPEKIPKSLNHVRTQTMGLIFNHRTIITIREELNDTTREL